MGKRLLVISNLCVVMYMYITRNNEIMDVIEKSVVVIMHVTFKSTAQNSLL